MAKRVNCRTRASGSFTSTHVFADTLYACKLVRFIWVVDYFSRVNELEVHKIHGENFPNPPMLIGGL